MTESSQRTSLLLPLSFLLSFGLHFSLAAYLLYFKTETPGAVAQPTPAISVNIETTDVIQAAESSPEKAAAASASNPPGAQAPDEQQKPKLEETAKTEAQQAERQKPAEEQLPPPASQAVEKDPGRPNDEAALEERKPDEPEKPLTAREEQKPVEQPSPPTRTAEATDTRLAPPKERPKPPVKPTERPEKPRERKQTASRGGPTAAGSRDNASSRGRVSASAGSVRNYGAIVRARIAARKPAGRGSGGTVVVSLSISPSGSLSGASVARSSGDRSLDQAALSAVRSASPFPPPPGGSARFTIPFQFR